jgi:hypothetical protein
MLAMSDHFQGTGSSVIVDFVDDTTYPNDYVLMGLMAQVNSGAGWYTGTSSYTVPAGKQAIPVWTLFTPSTTRDSDANRDARIWDFTDGSEILGKNDTDFDTGGWLIWHKDNAGFRHIPAGHLLRAQTFGGSARAVGGLYVLRIIDE